MGVAVRVGLWVGLAASLAACPASHPEDPGAERTIEKLKQEQARLAREGTTGRPPPQVAGNALADAVAHNLKAEELAVPATATATFGAATVTVKQVVAMQSVKGAKLTLTTADTFLKVALAISASKPQAIDVRAAQLRLGDQAFALATDAMSLGGGSPLTFDVTPGPEQPLVLFFELPRESLVRGLSLALTGTVEVPLQ